jgi:deoxyribodipyrimidine photolyase-related protein
MRRFLIILGDQLDRDSPLLRESDPATDLLWMAEVTEESTHVWSHKARIAYFLTCMRHFRDEVRKKGIPLEYSTLSDNEGHRGLRQVLKRDLRRLGPEVMRVVQPGEHRVLEMLREVSTETGVPLEVLEDPHFVCSRERFARHANGRKQLRMEYFYREMRRETGILLGADGSPEGGRWNFDDANRGAFGSDGPGSLPRAPSFPPDAITRDVLREVEARFPGHPGSLSSFDWPVTPAHAQEALDDFLTHRLPHFGRYQDAMWTGQPYLYHARLSAAMNVKLIRPLQVCRRAEAAWRARPEEIPLSAVEGFVRQILGWREYVRGIYWLHMPGYLERNELQAQGSLPQFYWTGDTDMTCLREVVAQTLATGYAHHIQRLMVTGLFALLLGVRPREVHEWYLAVYMDAVEWVELPNTFGMSQYADGGIMASKPYAATGKYISRMSNYCTGCRYLPELRWGDNACPFTTLYWDFLHRNRDRLANVPRMGIQLRNLYNIDSEELAAITARAAELRSRYAPHLRQDR